MSKIKTLANTAFGKSCFLTDVGLLTGTSLGKRGEKLFSGLFQMGSNSNSIL